MNVYEAPKAEMIEMNLNATVLTGSLQTTGEVEPSPWQWGK